MTQVFEAIAEELLGYYRKRLPNPQEAEDFVQQTFERLLTMDGVDNAHAVLYRIATNLLTDEYRARERMADPVSYELLIGSDGTGLDHLPQFQTLSYDDIEFAESHDLAVRELDDELRDAYILGELRGLPSREAAPFLGVSHTTAATRRELATTAIREEIAA